MSRQDSHDRERAQRDLEAAAQRYDANKDDIAARQDLNDAHARVRGAADRVKSR